MNNWSKRETQEIIKLIRDLWPHDEPLTEPQMRVLQTQMPGTAKVAKCVIEDLAARAKPFRPIPGEFIQRAREHIRDQHRLRSGPKPEPVETMTLREFLEHEDVSDEIAGMIERARKA